MYGVHDLTCISSFLSLFYRIPSTAFENVSHRSSIYWLNGGNYNEYNIIVGYHVWVEDWDTTWVDDQVTKVNDEKVEA